MGDFLTDVFIFNHVMLVPVPTLDVGVTTWHVKSVIRVEMAALCTDENNFFYRMRVVTLKSLSSCKA